MAPRSRRLPARPLVGMLLAAALGALSCVPAPPTPPPSTTPPASTTTTAPLPAARSLQAAPVDGRSSWADTWGAPRSGGRTHEGQDIFAAKGTPVVATHSGVVSTVSRNTAALSGNYVAVTADDGWRTLYIHLNNDTPGTDDGLGRWDQAFAPGVVLGQRVVAGQLLGWLGDSGNAESTSPHLHFELRSPASSPGGARPVNPAPSLRAAPRLRVTDGALAAAAPLVSFEHATRPTAPTATTATTATTAPPAPQLRVVGLAVDRDVDSPPLVVVTVNGTPALSLRPTLARRDAAAFFPGRTAARGFSSLASAAPGAQVCVVVGAVRGGGMSAPSCRTAP